MSTDNSPELPGLPAPLAEAGQKFFEALRPCDAGVASAAKLADMLGGPVNRGAGLEFNLDS